MSSKRQMPRNSAVPAAHRRSGSDSGDDYEIVGSPASRPSSWDNIDDEGNVGPYVGPYVGPPGGPSLQDQQQRLRDEAAWLKQQIQAIQTGSPSQPTVSLYVFLPAVHMPGMEC